MKLLAMNGLIQSSARQRAILGAAAIVVATLLPGCTSRQLEGASSSYLIVDALNGSPGDSGDFGGVLDSDVVSATGSVMSDLAKVDLRLGLKDPGTVSNPSTPTSANFITVTRYHVKYVRSDGRNTQGVDVPYEFDGGASGTVRDVGAVSTLVITLVRAQAKLEAPLLALRQQGGQVVVSTIAEVTMYGTDQAGRDVSVQAKIGVNFADFGG
jgi:hypothetical protein